MDRLLTVKEVSNWLNVPTDRVYSLSRENVLPKILIGRSLRFSKSELDEFISAGGKGLDRKN